MRVNFGVKPITYPQPVFIVSSYDEEACRMVGEIVNVCADESVLTDGKVDVAKLRPIAFDLMNMAYHVIGEQVGNTFSDGNALK